MSSEKLANCELGRTPLNYGLFKAISERFPINPKWLATNKGNMILQKLSSGPIKEVQLFSGVNQGFFSDSITDVVPTRSINGKTLFSEVYNSTLKPILEAEAKSAAHHWFGPLGIAAKLADFAAAMKDPEVVEKFSTPRLERLEIQLDATHQAVVSILLERGYESRPRAGSVPLKSPTSRTSK